MRLSDVAKILKRRMGRQPKKVPTRAPELADPRCSVRNDLNTGIRRRQKAAVPVVFYSLRYVVVFEDIRIRMSEQRGASTSEVLCLHISRRPGAKALDKTKRPPEIGFCK
jgi:hypothetical protein